jgi:hypothetical protein
MASAALVLIEEGTQALLGGKYLVEEDLTLAKASQLFCGQTRKGVSRKPRHKRFLFFGSCALASREDRYQEDE